MTSEMMRTGPKRKFIYNSAEYVYLIAGVLISFSMWALNLKGDELFLEDFAWALPAVKVFQGFGLYIVAALMLAVLVSMLVRQQADPWVIEKLEFILNKYQEKIFKNSNAAFDCNRVTLFRFEKGLWFKKHWMDRKQKWWRPFKTRRMYGNYLVPFMRSGHMALKTKTVFYIDSENSANTEGVAGEAWVTRKVRIMPDLPLLTPTTGKTAKESYAKVTRSTVRFLDKYLSENRQPPRSIVAMPVECNGKLWGVIVLDSRDALGVTAESVEHYTLTLALIEQLLERA